MGRLWTTWLAVPAALLGCGGATPAPPSGPDPATEPARPERAAGPGTLDGAPAADGPIWNAPPYASTTAAGRIAGAAFTTLMARAENDPTSDQNLIIELLGFAP